MAMSICCEPSSDIRLWLLDSVRTNAVHNVRAGTRPSESMTCAKSVVEIKTRQIR